jgi:putative ABC transport system permease protein
VKWPFSRQRDDDLRAEMQSHLDRATSDRIARGIPADEARREALREFGNVAHAQEVTREQWGWTWLEQLGQDVRYGIRSLRKDPGFTAIAILSLALGIGANTAIFSLMDAVALRSLPVRHPEQLVAITNGTGGTGAGVFTNPTWEQLRDRPALFAGSLAYVATSFTLAHGGEARTVPGDGVSGGFFDVLGVRPLTGRLLHPADDVRGCSGVVAISAGFATREYGTAEAAVGRIVSLGDHPFVIAGVVDPGFTGVAVGAPVDIYAPLCSLAITSGDPTVLDQPHVLFLSILGRQPEGVTLPAMQARLAVQARALIDADVPTAGGTTAASPDHNPSLGVIPAAGGISGVRQTYRAALTVLMVVVGLVLLIACANIANLLLARAASRGREWAIRLAVGAGRHRLIRQLLTESLILSLAGAAIGVAFAHWAARLLVGYLSTTGQPVQLDLAINLSVLCFTIGVAVLTGLLFGLAPAWRAAGTDPQLAMKAGGRGVVRGDRGHRIGKSLVVGQVALSLVLVAGAGLLVGSFAKLDTFNPGFQREGVLLAQLDFGSAGFKEADQTVAAMDVLRRIRQIPGVTAASMSMLAPLGDGGLSDFVLAPGFTPANKSDGEAFFNGVSEGYFATLHTALRAGRDITSDDVYQRRRVAVINETMARRVFGSPSPLGQSFRTPEGDSASAPLEVVGVVQDAKYGRLDAATVSMAYVPLGAWGPTTGSINYEVRSTRTRAEVVREVMSLVTAVSPGIAGRFRTLSEAAEASLTRPRMLAVLSAFFGGLALLLAMIGLYGTIAYSVVQRRSEIAVRIALGAGSSRVLRMVTGDAARIVVVGVVLGVLLTIAATRFLSAFLFGLTATDPATLAASGVALLVTGLGAASVPAWRGARLDPMEVLREE